MGNKLFQQARTAVKNVLHANNKAETEDKVSIAKNALSSAYANSTPAEQEQLREFQQQLEDENVR
ncbi:DUF3813 domain-containing protein [Peribacillus glennii]|uniref:DUF3813 domain-containing protein n=1 Tax=Peribacillus glennii TaxID=2303991 RepID=A0A372LA12_9BACI|nr:DUF3813 domain-containing protein [Peribacillus glennii]RFU62166.1 DUF3813 domain-containing protein [Peribacillus glennii]